jgi:hypothetical protein
MFSNFWTVLNRRNNATAVRAGGPLPWAEVDPAAQRVTIEATVTDARGVVAANGAQNFDSTQQQWQSDLQTAGDQLQRGKARARGWVTVIQPAGGAREPWEQDVWLN